MIKEILDTFVYRECVTCGIAFGSPIIRNREKDGRTFYCPNGHDLFFPDARKRIQKEKEDEQKREKEEKELERMLHPEQAEEDTEEPVETRKGLFGRWR